MVIRRLIELLAPVQCLHCGLDGSILCDVGVGFSAQTRLQQCFRCGVSMAQGRTCERCVLQSALVGVAVGAHYGGVMKELILQLKFHRLRSAAEVAAELIVQALPRDLAPDVVTAVPVAPERYRERGYNQAELIGRAVAARIGVRYAPLLGRLTSAHQLGRGRAERLAQIKGAFYGRRELRGEQVLIVDDVVTTGATLDECAVMLREAGAGEVWGGAVARH